MKWLFLISLLRFILLYVTPSKNDIDEIPDNCEHLKNEIQTYNHIQMLRAVILSWPVFLTILFFQTIESTFNDYNVYLISIFIVTCLILIIPAFILPYSLLRKKLCRHFLFVILIFGDILAVFFIFPLMLNT